MAERMRANGYQWHDLEVCMVWDQFHDQPERFYNGGVYGPLSAALEYVKAKRGWESRTVILKLPAIVASRLEHQEGDGQ
jgi:hypothetical protein